jgi:lipopolysaccharide/colanic/teichoic acid biosynthesis glycosyltransferase
MKQTGWRRIVKRTLDCTAAAIGLVVAAPVMAAVAGAIYATMGRPILFRQTRPGLHAKKFTLYKFRTMSVASGAAARVSNDANRLTPLGMFLRSTSLDELPQLWNILRGDMSLVGPRPLLVQYLPRYSPREARRHEVLPGLTGWAQINGRNAVTWPQRFELDVAYVDDWSLGLDLRILLRTVVSVLGRKGISQGEHATMPEFTGHAHDAN